MPPNLPWWLAPPPALLWLTETLVTGQGRSMESRAEILCEDGRLNWSRSFVRPVVKLELPYVISFSYVVSAAPNCGSMPASLLLRLQPNLDSFVAW